MYKLIPLLLCPSAPLPLCPSAHPPLCYELESGAVGGAGRDQNLARPTQPGMAMASETTMENPLIPIIQGDSQAEVSDSATSTCQWLSEAFPLRMAAML